jgi:hypothetical protein
VIEIAANKSVVLVRERAFFNAEGIESAEEEEGTEGRKADPSLRSG